MSARRSGGHCQERFLGHFVEFKQVLSSRGDGRGARRQTDMTARGKYVTPAAMNLIQGKHQDVKDFLEELAYGDNRPAENRQLRAALFAKMGRAALITREAGRRQ